ncbi:alpha/beta hydrolase [Pseudomonas sp. N3-W]|uniref:alpha/beta hydrolase family protein n=1 Tax=Pseudomonas sp. N3-W TaxID=2975049 RepID=UPI00217E814E|nr:alpha/beta hydrolase [Pseudomonas sp. N3-W]UWF51845.1 alpha/beta hydrolase [Pseudomonas sp. N3-W]
MNFQPRYWLAVGALAGGLGLISGCAGDPPDPRIEFTERVNKELTTAYQPSHNETAGWGAVWQIDQQSVDVAWLAPTNHERLPLIIYLPGLGEPASGGAEWRKAWAQAGYAVLSVQGHAYDQSIFASQQAQYGDFRGVASSHYTAAALRDRLSTLQKVLAEVRARAAKGDAQLAAIDWNQVVVAGFDLGAQTAEALAGALEPGATSGVAIQPKAVLLLSPYVEADAGQDVFARISAPVLSMTGQNDEDPFNWVSSYRQREVLGQSVTAAGSVQLELNKATHKTLSGTELFNRPAKKADKGSAPSGDAPKGKGHKRGAKSGGDFHGPVAGEPAPDPKQVAAIQAVGVAFLDSRIKHNPAATEWLQKGAPGWLEGAGRLK